MIAWLREPVGKRDGDDRTHSIELSGKQLPIELNRHARAKRMTLRLAPDGRAVRITLPRWCPPSDAVAFAIDRRDWLEAQLARIQPAEDLVARGSLRYRGRDLAIAWSATKPRRPEPAGNVLHIGGPADSLHRRLQRWLESEALHIMAADLDHYCSKAGLDIPLLRISRARRRWGSCSAQGTVRINWRLIQAPDPVRRSVVAHETAHLVHFDHGPQFHKLLSTLFEGDLRWANEWLKEHGRTLYSDFG